MTRGRGSRSQQQRDRTLQASCHGHAWYRIREGAGIATVVAEIRELAGDRAPLLVETAGVTAGVWSARTSDSPTELVVAAVLIQAVDNVDAAELARWVEVGRTRAATPSHTAS